jgi:signal transduction histidine kinase
MRTVRSRITVLAAAVSAVVLALAAFALVAVLDNQLTSQGDGAARARATDLAQGVAAAGVPSDLQPVTDEGLVQVVDASGAVLGASPNIRGGGPVAGPARSAHGPQVSTFTAPDDSETERYRVWSVAVETNGGVVTVFVGTSLEAVSEATRTLRTALLVGVPLMILLVAAGTWLVVGRALSRVERVRREVDQIGDAGVSGRLDPGPPDEIGRLVVTVNAMLARLEAGRREQRDFVADASHELQSPLTAFRAQLEVAQAHPDHADWDALAADLLEDTGRMETLVHDLLVLAAGESPDPGRATPVDLIDVVREAVAATGAPGVRVSGDSAVVRGDQGQLTRVVRNLLDNAVQHSGSLVEVEVAVAGGHGAVRVTDDGPGVASDQTEKVFERFHRGDPARSRADGGTGLGLAIARTLARRYGGDVVLEPSDLGAVFVLRVPLAQRPGPEGGSAARS